MHYRLNEEKNNLFRCEWAGVACGRANAESSSRVVDRDRFCTLIGSTFILMRFFVITFLLFSALNGAAQCVGFRFPSMLQGDDSLHYFLPLRDSFSRRSLLLERYAHLYYRAFDEPNLSIKPQLDPTIRLTIFDAFDKIVFITIAPLVIQVKKGVAHDLLEEDTTKLTALENQHLNLLRWNYPIDSAVTIQRSDLDEKSLSKPGFTRSCSIRSITSHC